MFDRSNSPKQPHDPALLLENARDAFYQGRIEEASSQVERLLSIAAADATDPKVFGIKRDLTRLKGEIAFASKKIATALECFRQEENLIAKAVDSDNRTTMEWGVNQLNIGRCLLSIGHGSKDDNCDTKDAIAYLHQAWDCLKDNEAFSQEALEAVLLKTVAMVRLKSEIFGLKDFLGKLKGLDRDDLGRVAPSLVEACEDFIENEAPHVAEALLSKVNLAFDPMLEARRLVLLTQAEYFQGNLLEAEGQAENADSVILKLRDSELLKKLHAKLFRLRLDALTSLGRYDSAEDLMIEEVQRLNRSEVVDREALVEAYCLRAMACLYAMRPTHAEQLLRQAEAFDIGPGCEAEAIRISVQGALAESRGDLNLAVEAIGKTREYYLGVGGLSAVQLDNYIDTCHTLFSLELRRQDREACAGYLAEIEQAIELLPPHRSVARYAAYLQSCSDFCVADGQHDQAFNYIIQAEATLEDSYLKGSNFAVSASLNLARFELMRGEQEIAMEQLKKIDPLLSYVDHDRTTLSASYYQMLVTSLRGLDDPDACKEAYEQGLAIFQKCKQKDAGPLRG